MKTIENLEYQIIEAEKKIVKIHATYLAIIFLLLSVFLILLAPISVCPNAFQNFSFASTIVSIVLAVVSIVFSFRTGKDSGENIAGIREIERGIESKLERFDSLKTEIEDVVIKNTKPIRDDIGNFKESQDKALEDISKALSEANKMEGSTEKGKTGILFTNPISAFGALFLYIASLSFKNKKSFKLGELGPRIEEYRQYMLGFASALSTLYSDYFSFSLESDGMTIKVFDNEKLGDSDYWLDRIKRNDKENKYGETVEMIKQKFS